jgi:hypothetical protein
MSRDRLNPRPAACRVPIEPSGNFRQRCNSDGPDRGNTLRGGGKMGTWEDGGSAGGAVARAMLRRHRRSRGGRASTAGGRASGSAGGWGHKTQIEGRCNSYRLDRGNTLRGGGKMGA